jgi:hypothetical protein
MSYREKNLSVSLKHLGLSSQNDVVVNLRNQNQISVFVMNDHNELIDITVQNIDNRMFVWVGGQQYEIHEGQLGAVDETHMTDSEFVNL